MKDCELPLTLTMNELTCWTEGEGSKILIDNVSGTIAAGEYTAVMGPSGAGKTTALDAIAGRRANVSGEVLVNGQPRSDARVSALFERSTGYMLQLADPFCPELTVFENVAYASLLRMPDATMDARLARVRDVLSQVQMLEAANVKVGHATGGGISGGQKRKLSLAIELLARPAVLFLDEPTSGLDTTSSMVISMVLQRYAASKRSVIMTIHQPRLEIFSRFSKLLLLYKGSVAYFGAPLVAVSFLERISSAHLPKDHRISSASNESSANPADVVLDILSHEAAVSARDNDFVARRVRRASQLAADGGNPEQELELARSEKIGVLACAEYQRELRLLKMTARMNQPMDLDALGALSTKGRCSLRNIYRQTWVLMSRELKRETWAKYMTLPLQALAIGLFLGTLFFRATNVISIGSVCFLGNHSLAGLAVPWLVSVFADSFATYKHERAAGVVSALAFFAELQAKCFFVMMVSFFGLNSVLFSMALESVSAVRLIYILMISFAFALSFQGLGLFTCTVFAVAFNSVVQANIIVVFAMAFNFTGFFNGLYLSIDDCPIYYRWVNFVSPIFWATRAIIRVCLEGYVTSRDCTSESQDLQEQLACSAYIDGDVFLRNFGMDDAQISDSLTILTGMWAGVSLLMLGLLVQHNGRRAWDPLRRKPKMPKNLRDVRMAARRAASQAKRTAKSIYAPSPRRKPTVETETRWPSSASGSSSTTSSGRYEDAMDDPDNLVDDMEPDWLREAAHALESPPRPRAGSGSSNGAAKAGRVRFEVVVN